MTLMRSEAGGCTGGGELQATSKQSAERQVKIRRFFMSGPRLLLADRK
jgi:hypothetical protein